MSGSCCQLFNRASRSLSVSRFLRSVSAGLPGQSGASYLVSPVTAIDARLRLMINDSQLQLIMVWKGLDHPEDYGEERDINTQGRLPSARLIFSTVLRFIRTPLCGSFNAKRTSRVLGLELLSYTAVHPIVICSARANIPPARCYDEPCTLPPPPNHKEQVAAPHHCQPWIINPPSA